MENITLDTVTDFIIENSLIAKGERIGIAVSGGVDSMALLNYLHGLSQDAGFSIIAIHVNHNIRANSKKDAAFVSKYCKQNEIDYVGYNVDVPMHAKQNKLSIEQSARILRYESFKTAITKKKLDKVAIAHHSADQAETILLNIFRGSGLAGASGMQAKRGPYIRPFLETKKEDLVGYCYHGQIPYIQDESNFDDTHSRNFLRNRIMPLLTREWRGVEKNITDFGKTARTDDEYLNSLVDTNTLIIEENVVRIPLNVFIYPTAVTNRVLMTAFDNLGQRENIEKKHLEIVAALAKTGENGSRSDLPNNLSAIREYEYLSIVKKQVTAQTRSYSFKVGKTNFAEYGNITVTKSISIKDAIARGLMTIDVDKMPRGAKWRTRKDGDMFTKFGGGTKTLNAYLIDKKIPSRLRDNLPVLAIDNTILAIAEMEISERVRTDSDTIEAFILEFTQD